MPTTSNFGWTTPADTDLVKDGALAIRTLGNGIDTSMAQLKGGTTGQVLSKTNGTDMAFTWVTQDDANAIQNAIVDAKGDLIAATANDTPARLAVGNNGETLVADSSATTGLRYTAGTVQSNPVINSAMQIWQRGTTFTNPSSGAYTADRWQSGVPTTNSSITRQTTGDTTNLPNIQYCARIQRSSGSTSTADFAYIHNLESVNSYAFAGKTITISFYARRGANYSATSNALNVRAQYSTSTVDGNAYYGPFASAVDIVNTSVTLTTTWQRFTLSGTVGATATQIGFWFTEVPVGTAGAADYYEITGVQIDIGSVALPFRTNGATLAGELAACQRYYSKSYMQTDAPATVTSAGAISGKVSSNTVANNEQYGSVFLPVAMRTNPTVTIYSYNGATSKVSDPASGTDFAANSGNASWIGQNSFMVINNSGGTLTTTRFSVLLHYVASAEL